MKTLVGRHINTSYGFVSSVEYGKSIGCGIIQVFLGNPQRILSKAKSEKELLKIKKELEKHHVKIIVHGSYTINLCHDSNSSQYETSVKSLVQDLKACHVMGGIGVIIHMGKNVNGLSNEDAIKNYVTGVREAIEETKDIKSLVVLETSAGQGNDIGANLVDLSAIYHSFTDKEKERIGFCIDTCHIWAAGYDISTKKTAKKFMETFNNLIGNDKIVSIHLNDSKRDLKAKVDRHADLGYGKIGTDGLKELCYFAAENKIPLIMETPLDSIDPKTGNYVESKKEIKKVKGWIKKHFEDENSEEK